MKIEIKDLCKKFKNEIVIDNVNYTFVEGNIYGIYGRNGTGKSVFLKLISGLYKPTSGNIYINGTDYNNNYEFCEYIGAVIEKPSFIDNLTGKENLLLLSKIKNIITENEIDKYIDIVNLTGNENKKYKDYSMGMKQKLSIIQSIMENQRIILLDEPFNGIDRESVNKIKNYLLKNKKNCIIIITTHIIDDINNFADVLLKFENGKIIEE